MTWYINPDNGGQAELAKKCGDASDGAFKIETQILPNEADQQREQLVRRLAANDPSIDLMSLDPPFVAEFANAGYLLPVTDPADVELFTDGVLEAPLEYRHLERSAGRAGRSGPTRSCCGTASRWPQAAGVDPTSPDFTWEEMIKAAETQGKRIGVQGRRYEGYMVWINALIASGGGQIIENPELGADATPTVASPAGDLAADIVGELARSSAAPADLSTAGEEESRSLFQGDDGSFMVNWPYVYKRRQGRGGGRRPRPVGRRRHRAGRATRRWRPARRACRRSAASTSAIGRLHQASGRGAGGGEVHHVAREQHRVHDQVGQPGGPRAPRTTTRRSARPSRWPT